MDRIQCPDGDCWQRVSNTEATDDDVCASHINATIKWLATLKERLELCINVTNTLPDQQKIYRDILGWIEKFETN